MKHFLGHIGASYLAVGSTFTQLHGNGRDRVIAYFSKKLSPVEIDCIANDRELLGLIFFLKRFRWYLQAEVEQKGTETVDNSWQHWYLSNYFEARKGTFSW